jgi:hypothetical protein
VTRRAGAAKLAGLERSGCKLIGVLASLLTACGGGAPLLHPAHTLPEGDVAFAAGTSGRFALGSLQRAESDLDDAAATPGGAQTDQERQGFAKGTFSRIAVAPGVAPFVAGRVGLGHHNEAGLSYTGRGARLDGRHAFEWPSLALSVGAAANGAFAHPDNEPRAAPGAGAGLRTMSLTSLSGYGLELPVLFGYRSSADVVKLWTGLRAGFERDHFNVSLVEAPDALVGAKGSATRYWGGGLVGFSIGLAPVEVRVEVDAAYESVHGALTLSPGDLTGDVAGWSLTPAMAISAKF